MTFSLELARRILSVRYEDLPPEAVHWAKVGVLDTTGVTIVGSRDDSTRIVERVAAGGSSGPSLAFGFDRRIAPLDAALVNGTASHALDFDDCNSTMAGHPSAPILPGLYALGDRDGASGRDFITAYVAGFETECKLSLGVNLYQYTKGWHPTVTLGVFGAAAAAGRLLGLSEEQMAIALGIAASTAAGIKSNFGTMTKPFHVGQCARGGLLAALLASEGFTAGLDAFEHKQGYFNLFNGEGNYDISKILRLWADPLDIVKPGIMVKQYPCCASTHAPADAMLELAAKHDLKPEAVARIESYTHARRLEHTNRAQPRSALDAKFSVQYVLSRALKDRCVIAEHFDGDAYNDPQIRSIMQRVHVAPYTAGQFPPENHSGAELRITLTDGRTISTKVEQPRGRTSADPLSPEQLKSKFEGCVEGLIHEANVAPLLAAIQNLEHVADVRSITALISRDEARQIAAA